MTTATTPTVTKRIAYSREDHDYTAYVSIDGAPEEPIGSRPTHHDASLLASDYIIQFYQDNHTPEAAASLIMQELQKEGRHEQAARDMGGEWLGHRPSDPEIAPCDYTDIDRATCYMCDRADCICDSIEPPIDIPSVLEVEDSELNAQAQKPCPNCGGTDIDYSFSPPRCLFCDPVVDIEDLRKRFPPEPPSAIDWDSIAKNLGLCCRNCSGLHHIQRCPEIGALLFMEPASGLLTICEKINTWLGTDDGAHALPFEPPWYREFHAEITRARLLAWSF